MNSQIERELKTLVTEEQFYKILKVVNKGSLKDPFTQYNTYYDTTDFNMRQAQATLRLRNFANSSEWTIKQQTDLHEAIEINQANNQVIHPAPKHLTSTLINNANIINFLNQQSIDLESLQPIMELRTDRWNIAVDYGEYAFDKSYYNDVIDYEIELETDNLEKALTQFNQLLNKFAITYQTAPTKLARAMQHQK